MVRGGPGLLERRDLVKTAIVAVLALLAQAKDRPQQGSGPEVGKPAPGWKLRMQEGKTEVDIARLKGKPVLLIFGSYT